MCGSTEKTALRSSIPLNRILQVAGLHVETIYGDIKRRVVRLAPYEAGATGDSLVFYSGKGPLSAEFSGAVFCRPSALPTELNPAATYLCCDNPRLSMIRAMRSCGGVQGSHFISASISLSNEAEVGTGVSIGPYCSVGVSTIEDESVLYPGVHVYDNVRVGRGAIIDSGAVIGAQGFGFERNERGELESFPHLGGVVIGRDVEIGANVTIDRGTFSDTCIGDGVKIDNGAYIAHNVVIGAHTLIMANVTVCGSVRIGERCWIAPSATIRDGIAIGDGATVGLGAVVISDVAPGTTVYGVPAKEQRR